MNITNFSKQNYCIPSIDPVLKQYLGYTYYVPSNYDNEYYQTFKEIEYLYDNCPLHASLINTLIQDIYGSGLIAGNKQDEAIIRKYKLNNTLKKCIYDYVVYGGCYLEVIWNITHTEILDIKHMKYQQVRLGKYDRERNEDIEIFYHSLDWKSWKEKEIQPLVRFNPSPNFADHQLYPIFYNENKIYPVPYYHSAFNDIYTMIALSKFYKHLIENNFSPDTMIIVPGVIDPAQEEQLRDIFSKGHKGPEGFKTILFNPESPDNVPQILTINETDSGNRYHAWNAIFESKIIQAHQLPSAALAGIKTPGQLGGLEELSVSYDIYKARKVYPMRTSILDVFEELNQYFIDSLSQIEVEDIELTFDKKTEDGTVQEATI